MPGRTIFIGDVHGCLSELQELLALLKLGPQDTPIFVGDIIGKGPLPIETLEFLYTRGYSCVLGNHELTYLKQKSKWAKDLHKQLSPALHTFIASMPLYISEQHYLVVHAGILPDIAIHETDAETLVNIRMYEGKPWHSFYQGSKTIIYGHWAEQGLKLTKNSIGLDTGCTYGGKLSAYLLPTKEILQVKAKKRYTAFTKEKKPLSL